MKLIKTEQEHDAALTRMRKLLHSDPPPGTVEDDELELLIHLIEEYEKKHFDLGMPDPVSAILFRMEQQGLSRADLVTYIGSMSKVSEVLNGRRPLSLNMIRRLSEGLGIPAMVLLQEQPIKKSGGKVQRAHQVTKRIKKIQVHSTK